MSKEALSPLEVMRLGPDDLAASAYRAYTFALAEEPNWDFLSWERQAPWKRLAELCERVFEGSDGKSYSEVGLALEHAATGDVHAKGSLAWQAVARHLMTLIDGEPDSVPNLDALERSWREWVQQRTRTP